MFSDKNHKYLEADQMTSRRGWVRLSSAADFLTGDAADYINLEGKIPGTGIYRSSIFKTPETTKGFGRIWANRALEINIPASHIGGLACAKWKDYLSDAEVKKVGAELLKALASTGGGFNELQAILHENTTTVRGRPVVQALIGVETPPSGSFADAQLKLLFTYHSKAAFFPIIQTDTWLTQIGKYIVARGLTETLMQMLGEGQSLNDLLEAGRKELPFPNDLHNGLSFYNLLPETLRLNSRVHGLSQLELGAARSEVRIPVASEVEPHIGAILNQSRLARELQKNYFTVSYCDGLADWMPEAERGTEDSESGSIADVLRNLRGPADFGSAAFGKAERNASNYVGPYLHIVADHQMDYQSRFDAHSGILLLIYLFREYFTGLSSITSKPEQE